MKFSSLFAGLLATGLCVQAADSKIAGEAVNALGLDLYRVQAGGEDNLLISPYSIQNALAMAYAGADGDTRAEMQRVLHLSSEESATHESFKSLSLELAALRDRKLEFVKKSKDGSTPGTSIEVTVANRLFTHRDYPVRPAFVSLIKESYSASLEAMDFARAPEPSRLAINRWVEAETKNRIRELIPSGRINPNTRVVLVNALYLRAPWANKFRESATQNERFLVCGREAIEVPTMSDTSHLGYAKRGGFQVVTRRYIGDELQFVIMLPDEPAGLAHVERALTSEALQEFARLKSREVILHLPKFRIEPPAVALAESLVKLGMKTAFDDPPGSANFDRLSPRKTDGYLSISEVLHKTFLILDEKGTEAGAATAVMRMLMFGEPPPEPVEVRVDRPFVFAIQHVPSGACLFLGRVTDPRQQL